VERPSTITTSSTYNGMRRRTQGMFWASFRVGITTLMEAPSGAAVGLENELGGWVEIDTCLTTSLRVENLADRTPP
jgi:hypothetical protein